MSTPTALTTFEQIMADWRAMCEENRRLTAENVELKESRERLRTVAMEADILTSYLFPPAIAARMKPLDLALSDLEPDDLTPPEAK